MSQLINITIDGSSGVGKGILAKLLAQKLQYILIDSGLMYRYIAYFLLKKNISTKEVLKEHLNEINFSYKNETLYVNDERVENFPIREPEICQNSSRYAVIQCIRDYINEQIKCFTQQKGFIIDGRNVGIETLPQAEIKFFIECPLEIKARRRLKDYKKQGLLFTLEEVIKELEERDHRDLTREISPLEIPKNAYIITNDDSKELEEHVEIMFNIVQEYFRKNSIKLKK